MNIHFDAMRRRYRHPVHRAVAAALALAPVALLGSPGTFAQDASAAMALEEIVVTARKTEEKLTEIPLSIAAYTADDLLKRNATSLADIAQYTAGFSYESYGGGGTPAPLIRGLTQNALTDRNQNVGSFVDGVHVQQQGNVDFSLLDLERVEIVKGPQNAQYGRSSFAGAINWVPVKPTLGEWAGYVGATYGTDERQDISGAVSIPLWQDKLAVRIAGKTTEFDGTWKNNFTGPAGDRAIATTTQGFNFPGTDGNLGGWDNESRSIALRFRPIDALTVDAMYYRSETSNDFGANYSIQPRAARQTPTLGAANPLNCSPSVATNFITGMPPGSNQLYCGEISLDANRISADPRSSGTQTHSDLLIGRIEYQFTENLSATYVYGRGLYDARNFGPTPNLPELILVGDSFSPRPGTGQPTLQFAANPITDQESESNEFRVDGKFGAGITWRLGYYASDVQDVGASGLLERRLTLALDPTGQIAFSVTPLNLNLTQFNDETTAQFGSIAIPFLDTWTVEAEARYAKEERRQTSLAGARNPAPREFSDFTPRVNLKWQPNTEWMFYGSAAKGTKAGGFNSLTADVATFEPEENLTFELGAKQALLQGRVQLNYSIFLIDWKDLQLSVPDTIPDPATPLVQQPNFIGNVSGAEAKGAEVELIALATDRLKVNFAGSYVQSTFDDDVIDTTFGRLCETTGTAACVFLPRRPGLLPLGGSPIGGNDLPRTPRAKASLGLEYTMPLAAFELSLRGDLNYQSKYYVENLNVASIPDRTLLNLNVSLADPDGKWVANLWSQNVTDELYASSSFAVSVINQYGPAMGLGRTAGVTVRYNFR